MKKHIYKCANTFEAFIYTIKYVTLSVTYECYTNAKGWEMISWKQDQGNGYFLTQYLKNDYIFDRQILEERVHPFGENIMRNKSRGTHVQSIGQFNMSKNYFMKDEPRRCIVLDTWVPEIGV